MKTVKVRFASSTKLYDFYTDLSLVKGDYCLALTLGDQVSLVKVVEIGVAPEDSKATSCILVKLNMAEAIGRIQPLMTLVAKVTPGVPRL